MVPDFPPLLTGHALKPGQNPARKAASGAHKGAYGAGDLLYVEERNTLSYAVVLEPDVGRREALCMVFTQMVALGDAVGALAPPEVAITYHWPNIVLANAGIIGDVRALMSEEDGPDGCPKFLIIATELAVRPKEDIKDPGLFKDKTTLWDEGCGDLDAMKVLDSTARHFLNWTHNWQEDGFQPILTQLDGRMERGHRLTFDGLDGTYLGMDEEANLLLKTEDGTRQIDVADALDTGLEAFV